MKYLYLILLFLLSAFVSAQDYTTVTKSGEYKLRHNGAIVTPYYGSQKDARAAAEKISNECHLRTNGGLCPVAVQQPELLITTKANVSSSSPKSSASGSSKSSSLTSSVSSQSESSASQSKVTLSWSCPIKREDGSTLYLSEIDYYEILVGTQKIQIKSTGCSMAHIIDAPDSMPSITAVDINGIYSKAIAFSQ